MSMQGNKTRIQELKDQLKAEQAKIPTATVKTEDGSNVTLKASEKGCVVVYGLQKFPVSLYPNQLRKLLKAGDAINQFIEDNKAKLSFDKKKAE